MTKKLNESTIEDATLTWFGGVGNAGLHGFHITPGELAVESTFALAIGNPLTGKHTDRRCSSGNVVLVGPAIPDEEVSP